MKIYYVSDLCTTQKLHDTFPDFNTVPALCTQKYHRVMAEGLAGNPSTVVCAVTILPINVSNCKKKWLPFAREEENGINYCYLPILNVRWLKNVLIFITAFVYAFVQLMQNKDAVILVDSLRVTAATAFLLAGRLLHRPSVAIVTDIPDFFSWERGWHKKLQAFLIQQYSAYVFLAQAMNERINIKKKPYVVIEGQANVAMQQMENKLTEKYPKKTCMYTGTIDKQYGTQLLTDAFRNITFAELHLYGRCTYEAELLQLCNKAGNIHYFGIKDNEYIVAQQLKATLLVNPRPTHEEYTKYSFPSKNMEYMASGTPVLTTRLPSMPPEYNEHVYLIEEETADGLEKALRAVLSKSPEELHAKGLRAKEFVLREKNNLVQAGRLIEMIRRL